MRERCKVPRKGSSKCLKSLRGKRSNPFTKRGRPRNSARPRRPGPREAGRRPGELFGPYEAYQHRFRKTTRPKESEREKPDEGGNPFFHPSRTVALEGVRQARAFDVGVYLGPLDGIAVRKSHERSARGKINAPSVGKKKKKDPQKGSPDGRKTSELSKRRTTSFENGAA